MTDQAPERDERTAALKREPVSACSDRQGADPATDRQISQQGLETGNAGESGASLSNDSEGIYR